MVRDYSKRGSVKTNQFTRTRLGTQSSFVATFISDGPGPAGKARLILVGH